MNSSERQSEYWNRVAKEKHFSHPLEGERFRRYVSRSSCILDLGCGYGRICADLRAEGYVNVIGIDISANMIERGKHLHPEADLRLWQSTELPFEASAFDAVLLFAVLTCIPSDEAQRELIMEIARVLRPDGVLYVSDFPIQRDDRNQRRYEQFESRYGTFGVFELPEGVILRHHTFEWFENLLSSFRKIDSRVIEVQTMNGNMSKAFQYFGRKQS